MRARAELLAQVTRTAAGVAPFAHPGGMLSGYLLIRSGTRVFMGAARQVRELWLLAKSRVLWRVAIYQ